MESKSPLVIKQSIGFGTLGTQQIMLCVTDKERLYGVVGYKSIALHESRHHRWTQQHSHSLHTHEKSRNQQA